LNLSSALTFARSSPGFFDLPSVIPKVFAHLLSKIFSMNLIDCGLRIAQEDIGIIKLVTMARMLNRAHTEVLKASLQRSVATLQGNECDGFFKLR